MSVHEATVLAAGKAAAAVARVAAPGASPTESSATSVRPAPPTRRRRADAPSPAQARCHPRARSRPSPSRASAGLVGVDDHLVALTTGAALAAACASAASATATSASAFEACRAGRGSAEPLSRASPASPRARAGSSAPSSGASRPWISSDPSGFQNTLRCASSCCSRASASDTRRYAAPHAPAATPCRPGELEQLLLVLGGRDPGSAREPSRTRARHGRTTHASAATASRLRATRTCSRAARGVSAQRQAIHSAHERTPDSTQPPALVELAYELEPAARPRRTDVPPESPARPPAARERVCEDRSRLLSVVNTENSLPTSSDGLVLAERD